MVRIFVKSLLRNAPALVLLVGMAAASLLTPHGAISRLDLIAYLSGFEIFVGGGNPYSAQEILARQRELMLQRNFPVMMWNPPIFFMYFAPVLSLPPDLAPRASRVLSVLCAWLLVTLGWNLKQRDQPRPPLHLHMLCAWGLLPFWAELSLAQNTSWVTLYVALGTALFLRSRVPLIAGALMAPALCKPHDFYLTFAVLAWCVLATKGWRVIIGALASVSLAGIAVYVINPAIWSNWTHRAEWPIVNWGANLPTFLHLCGVDSDQTSKSLVVFTSALLGLLVWWQGRRVCGFTSREDSLMWAWMVTPFFAPYGYFSDHVTLIFPVAYFIAALSTEQDGFYRALFIRRIAILSSACLALSVIPTEPIPLFWAVYTPGILACTYDTFRRRHDKSCAGGKLPVTSVH